MALRNNKHSLRIFPLLLLIGLASILLITNLQGARQLVVTLTPQQIKQLQSEQLLDFTQVTEFLGDAPTTEVPRLVTQRSRELQKLLNCRNRRLKLKKLQHGDYWVVENLVIGRESRRMGCAESITYTTNGDYTFFDNLETVTQQYLIDNAVRCLLCKRRKYIIFWQVVIALCVLLVILQHRTEWKEHQLHIAPDRSLQFLYRFTRNTDLRNLLNCQNHELRRKSYKHKENRINEYMVERNIFIGARSRHMGCAESITYTTSGNILNLDFLEPLASRWLGPISFAIHSPGFDLKATLNAIQYVRNCLPGSRLIRDYVSFHVYFSNKHMPDYIPYNEDETLNWPYKCTSDNGTVLPPPYQNQNRSEMYKTQANMTYPINVGRNIARLAANTHFIFACDIELYPSLGFVDQFLDMVYQNNSVLSLNNQQPPRVYPLPVFEIFEGESVPTDKNELMELYNRKRAQLFHVRVCSNCHKVPGYDNWINRTSNATEELQLFSMTLREKEFKYWEPFYVSDNREPFFDERVTWEGQSNKRIQGYAMCLLGYEYHVLYPAFLVHSPGIKKYVRNSPRAVFAKHMTRFIKSKIEPEYRVLYGKNANCVT